MKVKKGNKVKIEYTGKFDDGNVFDTSEGRDPIEFVVGEGKVIKGFEEGVIGMEKGEEKEIKIKPKQAYGERKEELIRKVPKETLNIGKEPEKGMVLALATPDGKQIPAIIEKVDEKEITLDLNHPLAGKNLNFKIKVADVQSK